MNLAELGIILASRSLPLAVVSSGDWLRPAATRPRRSHSLVFVGSRWSLAAQRSGDGSGERKAEFISPGGMPSRPGGSAVTTSCQRSQENNGDQSGAGLVGWDNALLPWDRIDRVKVVRDLVVLYPPWGEYDHFPAQVLRG
jgi:hypothetical protein